LPSLPSSIIAPALHDRCRLIKLRNHTKIALEKGWQSESNYAEDNEEIFEHITSGFNYGIMPKNGIIIIDCDTEKLYKNLPEHWKETLIIITGRDGEIGHHVFLECQDSPPTKITIDDKETRVPLGDIRGSDSPFYTVGAGSIHPDTQRKYQYVDEDAALVEVTWAEVTKHLVENYEIGMKTEIPKSVIITPKKSTNALSNQLGLRIEDFVMPTGKIIRHANGDIQGSHPIHGSTTGMNFAINPGKNVWHCYRHNCGGDPISWIAYAYCEVPEQDSGCLEQYQFQEVKDWLKQNGYREKIKKLDDEYHKEDPNLEPVNLKDILDSLSTENKSIDDEIEIARQKCNLPDFPEIDSGLFKDYVDFGKRVSYSLHEFHFAAMLTIISMTLGRRVLIQVGMTKVYTNVFTMVVGHTTISGKSVACNMAIDSFGPAITYEEPIAKFNSTNILRGTISEAALVQGLNDTYNSLWYYDDCAGFFEDAGSWNAHVLGTLCSLYDGSPIVRTLSKRGKGDEKYKWECPWPFVSLLFNTTNKDIEQVASARLFSSGFFPRLMWFYGQGGQPRKNEDVSESDKTILKEICRSVADLREMVGKLENDSIVFGVCEEIEDWKLNATLGKLGKEDEAYRTAVARGFIHAYKIATILTMVDKNHQRDIFAFEPVEYPIKIKIPKEHAVAAIKIVERYLIPRMMFVYDLCNHTDNKNHQIIVMKALNQLGGVSDRTKVLRRTHLNSKDLNIALKTMIESGEIKVCEKTKPGNDKPTTFIIKMA